MAITDIIITALEVAFGGFIIWGFWNEEKVVEFEDRILSKMGFKVKKSRCAKITKFENSNRQSKGCI